jgi:hypothetical protein
LFLVRVSDGWLWVGARPAAPPPPPPPPPAATQSHGVTVLLDIA